MDVIYNHYFNYNLDTPILTKEELLRRNLNSFEDQESHRIIHLQDTVAFVKNHIEEWKPLIMRELKSKSPKDYSILSTIYFTVGYDMGIAFNNDVVIDLSYPFYQKNPEEIFYFILHELSHVVLLNYHPSIKFDQHKTRGDLLKVARFHTLLEGLGVYLPYELRMKNSELKHKDYQVLKDPELLKKNEPEFNKLLRQLEENTDQLITDEDWGIISLFSQKRYWYIIGAKMGLDIEKNYSRDSLIQCIIQGEDKFFELYNQIKN